MGTDRIADFVPVGLERILSGDRHYSNDQIDEIIATCSEGLPETPILMTQNDPKGDGVITIEVDRRTALIKQLEAAAVWYAYQCSSAARPTPTEMAKKFNAIASAAQTLLDALLMHENDGPDNIPIAILHPLKLSAETLGERNDGIESHPQTTWNVDGQAFIDYHGDDKLLSAISGVTFLRDCAADAKVNEQNLIGQGERVKPEQEFIENLLRIWVDIFYQQVKTSVGAPTSQNPGQATGPLIRFVQACLNPLQVPSMTDDAIRGHIRRIQQDMAKTQPEEN